MKDGDGATPLHFAASRGHVDVVRWLLSKGARVTLDNFGKSPLNDAAENEQLEVGSMIPLTLFIRTIIGDWFYGLIATSPPGGTWLNPVGHVGPTPLTTF